MTRAMKYFQHQKENRSLAAVFYLVGGPESFDISAQIRRARQLQFDRVRLTMVAASSRARSSGCGCDHSYRERGHPEAKMKIEYDKEVEPSIYGFKKKRLREPKKSPKASMSTSMRTSVSL